MSLAEFLKKPFKRLNPQRGLVVDVPTWSAAHEYHREHQRFHVLSMHRPGVIAGLEVVAWNPPDNTVVINPGAAVDSQGNMVLVTEPQRFPLNDQTSHTAYLVLEYREIGPNLEDSEATDGTRPQFITEGFSLQELVHPPVSTGLELARIAISGNGEPITDAWESQPPGPDHIDLGFRLESGPRAKGNVKVGLVPLEEGTDGQVKHLSGAMNLVNSLNDFTGYQAEFKGMVNLSQEIENVNLLLMSGKDSFVLTAEWRSVLLNFLGRGGVLLGENCGSGSNDGETGPFQDSFFEMAGQLGRRLVDVGRGHPLMNSPYIFGQVPEGKDGLARVMVGDGIVFSDGDFGCFWAGGDQQSPGSRATIRSALELGANFGAYAHQRTHLQSIRMVTG